MDLELIRKKYQRIVYPWQQLEDRLGPLTVEEHWLGASYLAYGVKGAESRPAQSAGAAIRV